jgi:molecular chaperone Hsp31 and glyoxalase 3
MRSKWKDRLQFVPYRQIRYSGLVEFRRELLISTCSTKLTSYSIFHLLPAPSRINLPSNADLGRLLHEAHEKGLPTVTLCHGPAALLSTTKAEGTSKTFAYKEYESMCFTDKTDSMTPSFGYLPGPMPWKCQEALEKEGVKIMNTTETGAVTQDRELITGDSPNAAQNLGAFAAPILVKHAMSNN